MSLERSVTQSDSRSTELLAILISMLQHLCMQCNCRSTITGERAAMGLRAKRKARG